MDQGAIERAMDGASDGSESNRRSDGWFKRWIREKKERWKVRAFDQGPIIISLSYNYHHTIIIISS
jgi:hypothetical protein